MLKADDISRYVFSKANFGSRMEDELERAGGG